MSNLDRVVALLTRHREERRWTDERVAADMLREFGIDPDADGLPVAPAPAPVTHEPWPVVAPVAEVVPEAELEVVPPEPEPEPVAVEAEPEPAAEVAAEPAPSAEPEPDPPA